MISDDRFHIPVKVEPGDIDIFNKILEAYDNLCLVTAVHPEFGKLVVRVTSDTRGEVIKILKHLPFPVTILER
ncbi:MAG: DUF4911 domain-containing protein [Desulfitobacteriaceae bacterium]|nr:DUF4911 domain-containing protein [Desulfitobacteriaceae bacterium]MDD4751812.1 DUF4911 domain-containing protein [Desulfitobacteriaceae bacterium]